MNYIQNVFRFLFEKKHSRRDEKQKPGEFDGQENIFFVKDRLW